MEEYTWAEEHSLSTLVMDRQMYKIMEMYLDMYQIIGMLFEMNLIIEIYHVIEMCGTSCAR